MFPHTFFSLSCLFLYINYYSIYKISSTCVRALGSLEARTGVRRYNLMPDTAVTLKLEIRVELQNWSTELKVRV
jgi:hypothetical protein